MTNQEKWNYIVKEYHDLYDEKEDVVDSRWRQYCNILFGFQPLLGEISAQPSIHVGVKDHAIPDIVLCLNNQEIFDIELKRYSFGFSDRFEQQLISYLKLQTLSAGMIVCKEIYLYSYEIMTKEIKKVRISLTEDNPKGIRLVELLQKDTFNIDDIRCFVEETADDYTVTQISEKTRSIRNKSANDDPVYLNATSVIRKWCKEMHEMGKINFLKYSGKTAYSRFTTETMDQIITPQPNVLKGAYNNHFYAYEIRNTKDNGTIRFMLAFGHKNAPTQTNEQFLRVFDYCNSYPPDDWEWRIVFRSETAHYYSTTTDEELYSILNSLYKQIMKKESELFQYYKARFEDH